MKNHEKVLKDLEIINNNLKSKSLKVIMIKNLIESNKHDKELVSKILSNINDPTILSLVTSLIRFK